MDEDNLRQIFQGFTPELSDSGAFIKDLEERLATVELVRQQTRCIQRCNRRAIVLASLAGCGVGILLTILFPYIAALFATLTSSLYPVSSDSIQNLYINLVFYCLAALTSILITVGVYGISFRVMSPKQMSI